jgi:argonaute-like protein implicated in RNA metabolism and viral defense
LSAAAAGDKYSAAINEHLSSDTDIDFAIVICEKTARYDLSSPYYSSKISLAAKGIASQVVTIDLLNNESQLDWSLANIALQIFVKFGGHPWFVKPSPGGGDVMIGVGRSERERGHGRMTRYVGFSTCYTSAGLFKSVEVFKPQNGLDDYLNALQGSIEGAIGAAISNAVVPLKLVLHVSKKFGRNEPDSLLAALQNVQNNVAIQYVVLRVTEDHPFVAFDRSQSSFAPQGGLSIQLDAKDRLLILEGRPLKRDMRKPTSAPLWVTLQQSNSSGTTLDSLVQQIYELSVASWRGFNAYAKPITIHYSELIAELLSAADDDGLVAAISASNSIKGVPWFI